MTTSGKQWNAQELYDLSQRRKDLYPHDLEFSEGVWWYARGPKHDMAVGGQQVQALMLEEINRIMKLSGDVAFKDFSVALAEFDAQHPWRW